MTYDEFWEEMKRVAREHPVKVIMAKAPPERASFSHPVPYEEPRSGKSLFDQVVIDYLSILSTTPPRTS